MLTACFNLYNWRLVLIQCYSNLEKTKLGISKIHRRDPFFDSQIHLW